MTKKRVADATQQFAVTPWTIDIHDIAQGWEHVSQHSRRLHDEIIDTIKTYHLQLLAHLYDALKDKHFRDARQQANDAPAVFQHTFHAVIEEHIQSTISDFEDILAANRFITFAMRLALLEGQLEPATQAILTQLQKKYFEAFTLSFQEWGSNHDFSKIASIAKEIPDEYKDKFNTIYKTSTQSFIQQIRLLCNDHNYNTALEHCRDPKLGKVGETLTSFILNKQAAQLQLDSKTAATPTPQASSKKSSPSPTEHSDDNDIIATLLEEAMHDHPASTPSKTSKEIKANSNSAAEYLLVVDKGGGVNMSLGR